MKAIVMEVAQLEALTVAQRILLARILLSLQPVPIACSVIVTLDSLMIPKMLTVLSITFVLTFSNVPILMCVFKQPEIIFS